MNKAVDDALDLAEPIVGRSDLTLPDLTLPGLRDPSGPDLSQVLTAWLARGAPGVLNFGGRSTVLTEPLVLAPLTLPRATGRRVIRNLTLRCDPDGSWAPDVLQSRAAYDPDEPLTLSHVENIASIPVGALVEGAGVGRAVFVTARIPERAELTLSQPLWGASARQPYTFTRFRHALDLSRVSMGGNLSLQEIRVDCADVASGVLLPHLGGTVTLGGCEIEAIGDRGVTSVGTGCRGVRIIRSRITGTGPDKVALNVNTAGATLRDTLAEAGVVLHQGRHLVDGCDLSGGLVMTGPSGGSTISGSRFNGCALELTDEHCAAAGREHGGVLGGLTVTGNLFSVADPAPDFRWLILRPHGCGQVVANLAVTGNSFCATGAPVRRVEVVDIAHADLDLARTRMVTFDGNVFDGVSLPTANPVSLEFEQAESATVWTLNMGDFLPFGGHTRTVVSVAASGPVRTGMDRVMQALPFVTCNAGPQRNHVQLTWPEPCRGRVIVTARIDRAC